MKLLIILLLALSCSKMPVNRNTPEEVILDDESGSINLKDLHTGKIKRTMVNEVQNDAVDDSEIISEISDSINIFLTDEEKAFFNIGKKAPPLSRFFVWPLINNKRISSNFGKRNGKMHKGIDIPAPKNTPIIASNDGSVSFSGKKRGYGNVIILKHDRNIFTVYAHNSKNLVTNGSLIKKGQNIALMGTTGRSSGNHLHFEIRQGTQAVDPIVFINNQKK